jgi:hypothetical protein
MNSGRRSLWKVVARGKDLHPQSSCQRVVEGVVHLLFFPGSRVTTDQRVVAKQENQEVESAKRAGAQYAHHRNQAKDTNMKLRQQLANAPRTRRCNRMSSLKP